METTLRDGSKPYEVEGKNIDGLEIIVVENSALFPGSPIRGTTSLYRPGEPYFKGYGGILLGYMPEGSTFPFHLHRKMVDTVGIFDGWLELMLIDIRESSPTYQTKKRITLYGGPGEHLGLVVIPPGVVHGLLARGRTIAFDLPDRILEQEDLLIYKGESGSISYEDLP